MCVVWTYKKTSWVCRATLDFNYRLGCGWVRVGLGLGWGWVGVGLGLDWGWIGVGLGFGVRPIC